MNDLHDDSYVQAELKKMNDQINMYGMQLDELNNALSVIGEENSHDDVNRQITEYGDQLQRPSEIPAEDALDNIVRLQNQLKIIRRRNQLLGRENRGQTRQLNDRARELEKVAKELKMVCDVTGWHNQARDMDMDEQAQHKADVKRMLTLETEIRKELRAARLTIKRKEQLIVQLQTEVEQNKQGQTTLNKINNDIRVKQRDCRQLEAKIQRLQKEDGNMERALVALEDTSPGKVSLAYMETDREFLNEAVIQMKLVCRRQEMVIKAQLARQQQLQSRLDTVMKSLREMNLVTEFERNVEKSALVPSASREEPEDVSLVLPENEGIPIDSYRLLYKNNDVMRTNVARKNMLVLEKESVIQAMEAKLEEFIQSHNLAARQDDSARLAKSSEVANLTAELQNKHAEYRAQIEALVNENHKLRTAAARRYSSRSSIRSAPQHQ